jgi:hypothetical protein
MKTTHDAAVNEMTRSAEAQHDSKPKELQIGIWTEIWNGIWNEIRNRTWKETGNKHGKT